MKRILREAYLISASQRFIAKPPTANNLPSGIQMELFESRERGAEKIRLWEGETGVLLRQKVRKAAEPHLIAKLERSP